jgi:hypothetical protein
LRRKRECGQIGVWYFLIPRKDVVTGIHEWPNMLDACGHAEIRQSREVDEKKK